jgi:hypothetical protein
MSFNNETRCPVAVVELTNGSIIKAEGKKTAEAAHNMLDLLLSQTAVPQLKA